jgi:hypothetical protein
MTIDLPRISVNKSLRPVMISMEFRSRRIRSRILCSQGLLSHEPKLLKDSNAANLQICKYLCEKPLKADNLTKGNYLTLTLRRSPTRPPYTQ